MLEPTQPREAMLHIVETDKPLNQACVDLQSAVTEHKFGVMTVHDLKQTMAKKGVCFERECRIFEVCNPQQAKRVLEQKMEISTALPCRISVYEENGKTCIATIRPTAMLDMYGGMGLQAVAKEVEEVIFAIMTEAAG